MKKARTTLVTIATAALAVTTLGTPTSAPAIDVRHRDSGSIYESELARAYAPCTAPNTVTSAGEPACAPAVTSVCRQSTSRLEMLAIPGVAPIGLVFLGKPQTPAMCKDGDYVGETAMRYTGDFTALLAETPCASGLCTFADVVTSFNMGRDVTLLTVIGADSNIPQGNFELLGLTILGPDGLPTAAPGIGEPNSDRFVSDLTVPIEPCTTGDVCDLAPWTSPCDFSSGEIEVVKLPIALSRVALAHVVLRNVAGISPLCLTGTYLAEVTVRGTVAGCGTPPSLCTLPDTTLTVPLEVSGRDAEGEGLLRFSSLESSYETTQILGVRVIDPTGLPVATAGIAVVESLASPRVDVKGDTLRVRATIPVPSPNRRDFVIDPAAEPGLRVVVSDRDGTIYDVTIAAERWQLQPPIGSRWTYADRGGALHGVRKASVKQIAKKGVTQGYDIDLRAKGPDLSAADHASLTVNLIGLRLVPADNEAMVVDWHGTRTCRGTYPKLICK